MAKRVAAHKKGDKGKPNKKPKLRTRAAPAGRPPAAKGQAAPPGGIADVFELFSVVFGDDDATEKTNQGSFSVVALFETLRGRGWQPGKLAGWGDQDTARWYGRLIRAGLRSKSLPLAAVMLELLAARKPDTVRGVMYAVVSAGWLPDTGQKSYKQIQRLLNKLRKCGVIPFEWIVDTVRATEKPSSWSGLADFADTVRDAYRKDFWRSLPTYVCIVVEKDTVAGKVAPVTREYDVPLHPLRGYSSTSFAWVIARDWRRIQKPIKVYYVGDHDPSGRGLEQSIIEALREYGGREFSWQRLAVEPEHFDRFNIIPLAPKRKDTRFRWFKQHWGERCAEVEAIPAPALRDMVRAAIESNIPQDQWERLKAIEGEERRQWRQMMEQLRGGEAA